MRIVVVTDQWEPDAIGGSARVAAATARGFAANGHQVTVLAPRHTGRPAHEALDGLELERAIPRSAAPQTFGDTLGAWRWGRRRERPDVVVAHQATVAAGAARAFRGVPMLYVFHASAPLEERFLRRQATPRRRASSLALDPVLVVLERAAVRSASAIAVLSEYSRDLLEQRHPGARRRIVLARGGVDVGRFAHADGRGVRERLGVPAGRPLLLTVRRLEPRMGVEELLRTVASLDSQVSLAIAGTGMLESNLRARAASLGLGSTVHFLGRVPEDDLPGLYAAADLFVLPTVAYEGFGMATVEALAAGTPVVGTAVGATPEILTPLDPGLVAPGPEHLSSTILSTLHRLSPALRERCATYAATQFDWAHAMVAWNDALRRTVEPS